MHWSRCYKFQETHDAKYAAQLLLTSRLRQLIIKLAVKLPSKIPAEIVRNDHLISLFTDSTHELKRRKPH